MGRSKTIRVTANVQRCIDELKTAVGAMPPGESKKRAEAALAYLEKTFKGEKQPLRGRGCPVEKVIIKS